MDFISKIDMKLVFVNPVWTDSEKKFTLNKIYDIFLEGNVWKITCDNGETAIYGVNKTIEDIIQRIRTKKNPPFITLAEWREKQIDNILSDE